MTLWLLGRRGAATFHGATLHFAAGLKAMGRHNAERRMQVIERVVLTPQHSLHLVSVENQLILFAASPAGCYAVEHSLAFAKQDSSYAAATIGKATSS